MVCLLTTHFAEQTLPCIWHGASSIIAAEPCVALLHATLVIAMHACWQLPKGNCTAGGNALTRMQWLHCTRAAAAW